MGFAILAWLLLLYLFSSKPGVFACLLAVLGHHLLKGVPEIAPGFIHGFAFGKDFRPFFEVAGEAAFRRWHEGRRQLEFQLVGLHGLSFA